MRESVITFGCLEDINKLSLFEVNTNLKRYSTYKMFFLSPFSPSENDLNRSLHKHTVTDVESAAHKNNNFDANCT